MFIFSKKKNKEAFKDSPLKELKAFLNGELMSLEEVGDGVFSEKMMGDGVAIKPTSEVLLSPAAGEIIVVMDESFHAVGMRLANGIELLLHIGLDTVGMNGVGFIPYVKVGDKVESGDKLISFSKKAIEEHGYTDTTIMVITNGHEYPNSSYHTSGTAYAGETVIAVWE
ncbi:PTS glucose transporter subunit IIA [Niallia taxi]|uniref:PTS sugar transporter subunit IIA n=1 Tax=Niallia taxi TaxID=2499688 RepID=UPI002E1B0A55|nr:PTS glucose transporter subunit IIA [Niallia taxi]